MKQPDFDSPVKNVSFALVAFGSNLGDREQFLLYAWQLLGETGEVRPLRLSTILETEAVGGPAGQPAYLNAVGLLETTLPCEVFFEECRRIENTLGRTRTTHWGPRTIDLDLLLFGNETRSTPVLTIPHPRMLSRPFVLIPATEIAPDWIVPGTGRTIREWNQ